MLKHSLIFLGGNLKLLWSKIVLTSKETLFLFLHSMNWCSLTPALKQSLSVLGTLFHLPSQSNKGWISEHKSISSVFFSTPASGLTEVSPWNCQTTNTKRGTILILTIFLPRDYKAHPSLGPWRRLFNVDTERLHFILWWKQENSSTICPSLSPEGSISLSLEWLKESREAFAFSCL